MIPRTAGWLGVLGWLAAGCVLPSLPPGEQDEAVHLGVALSDTNEAATGGDRTLHGCEGRVEPDDEIAWSVESALAVVRRAGVGVICVDLVDAIAFELAAHGQLERAASLLDRYETTRARPTGASATQQATGRPVPVGGARGVQGVSAVAADPNPQPSDPGRRSGDPNPQPSQPASPTAGNPNPQPSGPVPVSTRAVVSQRLSGGSEGGHATDRRGDEPEASGGPRS
ncbi:MAG: hypothetical protein NZ898_03895 [Myxococcota bacterium]|nr:hypothetical protein [Myxococcota bacterium]MDW8362936.1 hypothetical protein [Myxococcales bacterium]